MVHPTNPRKQLQHPVAFIRPHCHPVPLISRHFLSLEHWYKRNKIVHSTVFISQEYLNERSQCSEGISYNVEIKNDKVWIVRQFF